MSDDLIKRSDAIEAVEIVPFEDYGDYQTVREAIMRLPTADRPQGEWKISNLPKGKMKYCSECGFGQHIKDERMYSFCPNCGADMRGTDDE